MHIVSERQGASQKIDPAYIEYVRRFFDEQRSISTRYVFIEVPLHIVTTILHSLGNMWRLNINALR